MPHISELPKAALSGWATLFAHHHKFYFFLFLPLPPPSPLLSLLLLLLSLLFFSWLPFIEYLPWVDRGLHPFSVVYLVIFAAFVVMRPPTVTNKPQTCRAQHQRGLFLFRTALQCQSSDPRAAFLHTTACCKGLVHGADPHSLGAQDPLHSVGG